MKSAIVYGDRQIQFDIVPNQVLGTKIRIHVHPNANVEVEAPIDTSQKLIKEAVAKRARWIVTRLAEIEEGRKHVLPREYISGETHFYLGRRYQLKVLVTPHTPSQVQLKAGLLRVSVPHADAATIRRRLNSWYKERAESYFRKRLDELATSIPWIDKTPPIKIVTMRKQWGSCTPSGSINLNPWLIRAPRECIDYVIRHELCHLKEHNHSKAYYKLLDKLDPAWRPVKSRLDGLAELLLTQ